MTLELDLSHRYPDFDLNVAFTVPKGGVTALFGSSGSGKSTTLKIIAGLIRPAGARVLLDDADLAHRPPHRRRLGLMFQDSRLFPHLSVRQNLLYGAKRSPNGPDRDTMQHIVSLLGIGALLDRRPAGLSGGEAQRVALGRTLMTRPQALLLDEPLASLDQARKEEILPYLQRIPAEADIPILYVSHALDEVTRLADRMVVLDQGRVAAAGSVPDVLARLDLFPLTGRFEAGAIIDGRIAAHDTAHALSVVGFEDGRIWVPAIDAPTGTAVRVRIRARDVMLATAAPENISANTVLHGVVSAIRTDSRGPFQEVQVTCGATRILARITRRSADRLGIGEGTAVFAIIKTATVDRRLTALRPAGIVKDGVTREAP